jgi:hypothetical protein
VIALLKMPRPADATRRLERRNFPRKEIRAEIEGRRLDHTLAALRQPVLKMSLRDLSAGGLCALSDTPIPAGESVTISVPASMTFGGWDAYGRVIRCSPSGIGYHIAVEFDRLPAA